jgi:DNA-binding PadR family transcriptional regulator
MQKDGLIALTEDDGRRKTYQITLDGEQALREEYRRLVALVRDGALLREGENDG